MQGLIDQLPLPTDMQKEIAARCVCDYCDELKETKQKGDYFLCDECHKKAEDFTKVLQMLPMMNEILKIAEVDLGFALSSCGIGLIIQSMEQQIPALPEDFLEEVKKDNLWVLDKVNEFLVQYDAEKERVIGASDTEVSILKGTTSLCVKFCDLLRQDEYKEMMLSFQARFVAAIYLGMELFSGFLSHTKPEDIPFSRERYDRFGPSIIETAKAQDNYNELRLNVEKTLNSLNKDAGHH